MAFKRTIIRSRDIDFSRGDMRLCDDDNFRFVFAVGKDKRKDDLRLLAPRSYRGGRLACFGRSSLAGSFTRPYAARRRQSFQDPRSLHFHDADVGVFGRDRFFPLPCQRDAQKGGAQPSKDLYLPLYHRIGIDRLYQ